MVACSKWRWLSPYDKVENGRWSDDVASDDGRSDHPWRPWTYRCRWYGMLAYSWFSPLIHLIHQHCFRHIIMNEWVKVWYCSSPFSIVCLSKISQPSWLGFDTVCSAAISAFQMTKEFLLECDHGVVGHCTIHMSSSTIAHHDISVPLREEQLPKQTIDDKPHVFRWWLCGQAPLHLVEEPHIQREGRYPHEGESNPVNETIRQTR